MNIGILGGGQLGRMLALAGYPLALRFRFLDAVAGVPADFVATRVAGSFEDAAALEQLAAGTTAVTYEFENVPVDSARKLAAHTYVFPPPQALEAAQDRLHEKTLFHELGIPVPAFATVDSLESLTQAVAEVGLPAVLKTRRMGYDGKGQAVIRTQADIATAWRSLGGVPLLLEGFVPFETEVSLLAVRSKTGETAFYPLVENEHIGGILRLSRVPARGAAAQLQEEAETHARKLLANLDYVGVLAIEFFVAAGHLLANEMAPRVHNSGHWTIEGAETSQFENHLRAGLGLPLGLTTAPRPAAMLNLIGTVPEPGAVLAIAGTHLHLYDKTPREGRKLGHITLLASSAEVLEQKIAAVRSLVEATTGR